MKFRPIFMLGLALPLILGVALWRVKEARSYLPRDVNFRWPFEANVLPLAWRQSSIFLCGWESESAAKIKSRSLPASRTPLRLGTGEMVYVRPTNWWQTPATVSQNGVLARGRGGGSQIELWRNGKLARVFEEKAVPNQIPLSWRPKDDDGLQEPGQPELLAISPDGNHVAASSQLYGYHNTEQIQRGFSPLGFVLFNAQNGRQIARVNAHESNFVALEFSPDSRQLAALSLDGWLFILDAKSGKTQRKWRAHSFLAGALAWSPDGKSLVSATNNRPPRYSFHFRQGCATGIGIGGGYRVSGGSETTLGDSKNPCLKVSSDTKTGQLRFSDRPNEATLKFWNAQTGRQRGKTIAFSEDAHNVVWHADRIAVGGVGKATILNAKTGASERVFPLWSAHEQPNTNDKSGAVWAQFSPDGRHLALGSTKRVRVYRLF